MGNKTIWVDGVSSCFFGDTECGRKPEEPLDKGVLTQTGVSASLAGGVAQRNTSVESAGCRYRGARDTEEISHIICVLWRTRGFRMGQTQQVHRRWYLTICTLTQTPRGRIRCALVVFRIRSARRPLGTFAATRDRIVPFRSRWACPLTIQLDCSTDLERPMP